MNQDKLVPYYRAGILLLLLIFLLLVGVFFQGVLTPFVLAGFLAYILSPVVDALSRVTFYRWRLNRGVSILLIYLAFFLTLSTLGRVTAPILIKETKHLAQALPQYWEELDKGMLAPLDVQIKSWKDSFEMSAKSHKAKSEDEEDADVQPPAEPVPLPPHMQALLSDYAYVIRQVDATHFELVAKKRRRAPPSTESKPNLEQKMSEALSSWQSAMEEDFLETFQILRRQVVMVFHVVFTIFLVFMIAAFLLLDPGRVHRFAKSLLPLKHQSHYDDWIQQLDHGLSGVVRGQLLICLLNGVLTGIGLFLLNIPYALLLSLVAAVFSLIPIFGVLVSSFPIIVFALTQSPFTALLALGWILVIHFLEGNFFNPKILGDAARIHPVWVVFALVVGQYTAGMVGALVAVPIFSMLQNSFMFLLRRVEHMEGAA